MLKVDSKDFSSIKKELRETKKTNSDKKKLRNKDKNSALINHQITPNEKL